MGLEGFMLNLNQSILFPAFSLIICMLIANYLGKTNLFSFLDSRKGRFGSIDGVRGFLALFVVFHHFIIVYYWKVEGAWQRPPEDIFQNYGKVGVVIFFMITGYLFFAKINNKERPINWILMFKSRLFRILPLYIFALLIITLIVFNNSNYQLNISPAMLVKDLAKWGLFIGGTINGFLDTRVIIAGVDWTLKYEWLFYFSLPIIALVGKKVGVFGLIVLVLISVFGYFIPVSFLYFSSEFLIYFSIGAMTSCISKGFMLHIAKRSFLISTINTILITLVLTYPNTLDFIHVIMISVLFIFIAAGNTLFGLLSLRASVVLGEISYSIYLLHGIILYVIFTAHSPVSLSDLLVDEFMYFMPPISAIIVLVSAFTYLYIEKPSIEFGRKC